MNTKRLVSWGSGAAIVLALLVFFGWFWSLGSVHAGPPPVIQVETVNPPVEWRRATDETWASLTEATTILPGDRIRTGEGGEARIVWGDRGYTRIDPDSEIVVEATPGEGALVPGSDISIQVVTGRVWSRMLKLLDLDSSMEVKTSDVVATVRGTTFGVIKKDESEVAVAESVVEVANADGSQSTMIRDQQWGKFGAGALMRELRDLRVDDVWAQNNMKKDQDDDVRVFGAMREYMMERARDAERGPRLLVRASERLRLSLAGKEAPKLAALYAERHLARGVMERTEGDMKTFVEYAKQAGPARGALLGKVHSAVALQARQQGIAGLTRERGVRRELADAKDAARSYLDAIGIDERIDDAIIREGDRSPERLQSIQEDLGLFEKRLADIEATSEEKIGLTRKVAAMQKRLEYVMTLGQIPPPPLPTDEVTDIPQGSQIPDPAKPKPPVLRAPTTPATPVPSGTYQRFVLLVNPAMVEIGQPVRLSLFGVTADGKSDDLTARAAFSAATTDGTVSGNVFTPARSGTLKVNASYADHTGTRTTSASVVVNVSKTPTTSGLQRIAFSFTGPTTLPCNGRSPFKIIATYADGKTQDVTMLSTFSVSDAKVLLASEGVVTTFCMAQKTTATVMASYTDGGVKKTASAVITLDPEPPPQTSGGGGSRYPYYMY